MKVALILASVIAIALGGIRTLNSDEEAEIWNLWLNHCVAYGRRSHSSSASSSEDDNTVYYCKDGESDKENIKTEKVHHVITVTPGPESPSQVIFVRPPPVVYKHNLTIKGEAGSPLHTKVYVLPQNASHKYDYVDQRKVGDEQQKPSLYFLNEQSTPTARYGTSRASRHL